MFKYMNKDLHICLKFTHAHGINLPIQTKPFWIYALHKSSTKQYLHVSLVSNDRKMCEVSGEKV